MSLPIDERWHAGHWTREHISRIDPARIAYAPLIRAVDRLSDGIDFWDYWPVQTTDGHPAAIAGGVLYMFLSAPALPDPDTRHAVARIRLMLHAGDDWRDLGPLLGDQFSPGSREWSGSAIVSAQDEVTLYYTAAGRRGEAEISFEQRLFETRATLSVEGDAVSFAPWSQPREMLVPDGIHYMREMAGGGAVGTIKAFRDPAYFRDPADGAEYVLFAASLARSRSPWNGAVGIARRSGEAQWSALPPLIEADGLNNELERPHVVVHGGRYYLFWSTQQKVFASGGPAGPTGLYGMVADRLSGPWEPINGSGMVIANPPSAPFQAYSWLVLPDLRVQSFADLVGLSEPPRSQSEARAHFGGSPAPELQLALSGDRAWLA
ncbi:MAG TPA: glycoside hydrolase family 68 protein [Sphingomonas sp.]|nr:glycoside hydrolase family 68 protein [Sphingomonas sp.]